MNVTEAAARLALHLLVLWFWVIDAAVLPYALEDVEINTQFLSIFLGTDKPFGWALKLFLVSRFFFGAGVAIFIVMPVIKIFMDADVRAINRDIFLLFMGFSTAAFMGGLVVRFLFQL